MASTDDRIVAMRFDNRAFQNNVDATIRSLDALKKSLDFSNSARGFADLSASASRVDLQGIGNAVDTIAGKFTALGIAGVTTLGTIVNKAVETGAALIKSLSLDGVVSGFQEYQTNINSIQTILANTESKGTTLQQVNDALDELNRYSDQTIYNFSEMARNVGTFTAAGVDLETSVGAIKGIANLAAISGSSAEQASTAMYQLSQAIATGTVRLIDWNSVQNASIGGEIFQKALFETGKALGTINGLAEDGSTTFEEWKKVNGSFRESLSGSGKAIVDETDAIAQANTEGAQLIKDAEKDVADTTQQAAQRVLDAKQRVKDAATQGADAIANASERQKRGIEDDAKSIKEAWQTVIDARKRLENAMKPASENELEAANDRLKTSQLDQADLADAVTRAELDQTKALDREHKARLKLAAAQKSGDLNAQNEAYFELQDAINAVTDAQDAVTRAELAQRAAARDVADAEENLTEVKKKGTDQDQNVVEAKENLETAEQRYARELEDSAKRQKENAKDLAQAKEDSVRRQEDAVRNLADVEEDRVKAIARVQDQLAKAHEEAADRIANAGGAVEQTWLTSDVLTTTLQAFTGDLDEAGLVALGYSEEQAKQLVKIGKTAQDSAKTVKTLTQLISTVKETIGSGWSASFRRIFGTFDEAKTAFTNWNDQIGAVINRSADARNAILDDWQNNGGRVALINGITQGVKNLVRLLKPVREAFREIFPRKTGKELADITKKFFEFTKKLKFSSETADKVKRIFKGFFALLNIGFTIFKAIIGVLKTVVGLFGKLAGPGILSFFAMIGDGLVRLNDALVNGGIQKAIEAIVAWVSKLAPIFSKLGSFLSAAAAKGTSGIVSVLLGIGKGIASLGSSLSGFGAGIVDKFKSFFSDTASGIGAFSDNLSKLKDNPGLKSLSSGKYGASIERFDSVISKLKRGQGLKSFSSELHGAARGIEDLKSSFGSRAQDPAAKLQNVQDSAGPLTSVLEALKKVLQPIVAVLGPIVKKIGDLFSGITFNQVGFAAGAAGLAVILWKVISLFAGFVKSITGIFLGVGNILHEVAGVVGEAKGVLSALQTEIKARALIKVAIAIAILAGSLTLLSFIDPVRLGLAGFAIGALFALLQGALQDLSGMIKDANNVRNTLALAAAMVLMAGAIFILSMAVKKLSKLDPARVAVGVGAVSAMIYVLANNMKKFTDLGDGNLLKAALGLWAMAASIKKLAGVIQLLGAMDPRELLTGLAAVGLIMTGLTVAINKLPKKDDGKLASLVGFAFAIRILAWSVRVLGEQKPEVLAQGLLGFSVITVAMIALFTALDQLKTKNVEGLGLALTGFALGVLAITVAIAILGNLDFETLAKGAGTLVVVLTAMGIAVKSLTGGQIGAAVIAAVAGAFLLLAFAFEKFGKIGYGAILAGLVAFAGVLVIVGLAAVALSSGSLVLIPALYALGSALLYVGAGFALIGVGAFLLAKAFEIIYLAGKKGLLIFGELLKMGLAAIPKFIGSLGDGFLQLLKTIVDNGPMIIGGLVKLIIQGLQGLRKVLPELGKTVGELIDTLLKLITEKTPRFLTVGYELLLNLLKGLLDNIGEIASVVFQIAKRFIDELTAKAPELVKSGLNLLTSILNGIANNLSAVIKAAGGIVIAFVTGVLGEMKKVVAAGTTALLQFLSGVREAIPKIADAISEIIKEIAFQIGKKVPEVVDAGMKMFIALFKGIAKAIDDNAEELGRAMGELASALVKGIGNALKEAIKTIANDLFPGLGTVVSGILDFFGIASPSKLFYWIGDMLMTGFKEGIDNNFDKPVDALSDGNDKLVNSMSSAMQQVSDALSVEINSNPTITPVLDLTNVQRGAAKMASLLEATPIDANLSTSQASAISAAQAAQAATTQEAPPTPTQQVNFNQTINAPTQLSAAVIYRQTKSQIAIAKEELRVA